MSAPSKPTPTPIWNRPALSRIARRIGTHSRFKESMLRSLASADRPGLSELATRDDTDFTVALVDGWATVADILSFYAERSANEAYLRTATELRSVRSLARQINSELAPAKAAGVHLAFTAEAADAPAETLEYPAGLQVKSIPRDGEAPQTFETVEPLTARAEWNAIRPRMSRPQVLDSASAQILLTSDAPKVARGETVIFLRSGVPEAFSGETPALTRKVNAVERDPESRSVTLSLVADPPTPPVYAYFDHVSFAGWELDANLTGGTLFGAVSGQQWSLSQLYSTSALIGTSLAELQQAIVNLDLALVPGTGPIEPHVFRVRAPFFGHNAVTQRGEALSVTAPGTITDTIEEVGDGEVAPSGKALLFLDRVYDDIAEGSLVVVRSPGNECWVEVEAVESVSVEGYGLSGQVTRLTTAAAGLDAGRDTVQLSAFQTRTAVVLAALEPLPLADLPIDTPVGEPAGDLGASQIELDGPYLTLLPGKEVAVSGERADLAGVAATEIKEIADNVLNDGLSVLRFTSELASRYVRDTVVINANVAWATHGESVAEILGDGDATKPFQSFALKQYPLTYVSAKTPSGMAAVLQIRVDGVLWTEVADFSAAGPADRVYVLRQQEDGRTRVVFGDGLTGARLRTGLGIVTASYRKGAGAKGMLAAGQLTLLATRPAGLKGVTNPLPPSGAAAAETIEAARVNAPLKILTLGRIVSLRDYEDFAHGFAAVAKARANWIWTGRRCSVFLTIAGTGGVDLPEAGDDFVNLRSAIASSSDSEVTVEIRNFRPVFFNVGARLFIDPAYESATVLAAAEAALRAAFSFDAREIGQPVMAAEIITVLQGVEGVNGVALDALFRAGSPPLPAERLAAAMPRSGSRTVPEPAELLMLSPEPPGLEPA